MKRPVLYWVVVFLLGEVLCRLLPIGLVIFTGITVFLIYGVTRKHLWREKRLQLLGIVFFLLGVFCMQQWKDMSQECNNVQGEWISFVGTVYAKKETEWYTQYTVKGRTINEVPCSVRMLVRLETSEEILLGSVIKGEGKVSTFNGATNPGGYDEKAYQNGNGVLLKITEANVTEVYTPSFAWRDKLFRLQKDIVCVYEQLFEAKNASLATAMVLGDKQNLDMDVKELYQRNGIAHLIAISGLHIAMIGGMLYQFLRKFTGSYPFAAAIGATFIVCYGVMTGLSGATMRAIIMLVVSIGADICGRKYDGITAIALALFVMLIGNPYQFTQVGFLLSFGAVIGIAVINPIWKLRFPKLPKVLDGFLVSVSVQLVITPILLYYFYELPLYGIFLNMVVVPMMSWLLFLLILCAVIGSVSVEIAFLPARLSDGIFYLYEMLCRFSETIPGHTLCTGRPSLWWMILYYLLLALFVWSGYRVGTRFIIPASVAFFVLFATFLLPSKLLVCMFDVGQGDSIYIRTSGHAHILVDGGSSTKSQIGAYVLKNGLKYHGANHLDYVFITHMDSDHYSGIMELLEEQLVPIDNLVLPAIANPDESYQELEQLAHVKGCQVYYMKRGDVLSLDGVIFRCLNPEVKEYADKNKGSIVMQMTYEEFDLLLTGDADETVERDIQNDIVKPLEVLKVAHHGSATSSSESFLREIAPAVSVISVGEKNRYGHPAQEVMERLSQYAQKIYLTKNSGAITIETDGKSYSLEEYIETHKE